ncbi:MAG: hypothetical protein Fur003_3280 [Candidatus Dojkabacteria bacterium]
MINFSRDYLGNNSFEYWNGMNVSVVYRFRSQYESHYQCLNDEIYLKLENGQWKVASSYGLPLGYFDDNATDNDQQMSNEFLINSYDCI